VIRKESRNEVEEQDIESVTGDKEQFKEN